MSETRQLKVVIAGDAKSARNAIRVLNDGLDETDGASKRAGSGLANFGEKIKSGLGVAAGAVAGLALAGGIGAAFTQALDLSAAKAKLTAQLGDGQYASDMGNIAGKLYTSNFGDSVAGNMEAIRQVLSSGLLPEDAADADIERITGKAMNLASVFGIDVQDAAKAAGQMVKTGLAGNADQAMDIMVRGFQQTGDQAGDLMDTMNEYGTQFRKVGVDGTTAMGLISQGLQAGARDTDLVADAIKEFSIRAIDGSKLSGEGFQALGLDAQAMTKQIASGGEGASKGLDTVLDKLRGMKDPVAQSAAATALFGTQAEDLGSALFALDPSKATDAMGNVAGAADAMGKNLQSPQATLEELKRKLEMKVQEGMQAALPKIAEAATKVADFVTGKLIPAISDLYNWYKKNEDVVNAVAIALGVGVIAWQAYMFVTVGIPKILQAVKVSMMAVNAAMRANPIGIIVTLLLALAAGFAYLFTHNKTFHDAVIKTWDAIKGAVMAVVNWFKDDVPAFFSSMKDKAVSVFNGIVNFLKEWGLTILVVIGGPIAWIVALVIKYWDEIKAFTLNAWNAIVSTVMTVVNAVVNFVVGYFTALFAFWSAIWNGIATAVSTVWEWIKTAVSTAITWVVAFVTTYINTLIAVWTAIWNGISDAVSAVWGWIKNAVSAGIKFISDGISFGIAWIRQIWSTAWNWVKEHVSGAWNGIKNAVSSGIEGAVSFVRGLPGKAMDALGNIGDKLFDSGKALIQGFIDGIKNMAGNVKDAVLGVLKKARDLLPWSPAKEGPFSGKGWTLYSGESISQSLADGITNKGGQVAKAMGGVMGDAHSVIPSGASAGQLAAGSINSATSSGGVTVNVTVQGTVTAERDLVKAISLGVRDEIARNGKRNGGRTGL